MIVNHGERIDVTRANQLSGARGLSSSARRCLALRSCLTAASRRRRATSVGIVAAIGPAPSKPGELQIMNRVPFLLHDPA